jgi:opacity protein-like surface antigen
VARAIAIAVSLVSLLASRADAQTFTIGGALGASAQRFDDDPDLDRLDGTAVGIVVTGGLEVRSVLLHVEGSLDFGMNDARETPFVLNGRSLTVRSTLEHDTRALALLGGYAFALSDRFTIHALGGVSSTGVNRTFTTNAGILVLTGPSTPPPVSTDTSDRFTTWSLGADLLLRRRNRVQVIAGFRAEPLQLQSEISGHRIRVLGGASWRSR